MVKYETAEHVRQVLGFKFIDSVHRAIYRGRIKVIQKKKGSPVVGFCPECVERYHKDSFYGGGHWKRCHFVLREWFKENMAGKMIPTDENLRKKALTF